MRGRLIGITFTGGDVHTYNKIKSDSLQKKFDFGCKLVFKGSRVILHTEYLDSDDNDFKVIYTTGKHNHGGAIQNSYYSETGLSRGRKRKYTKAENE